MKYRMKQCCNENCNHGIYCEDDAWQVYKRKRMEAYKQLLTNKTFQCILSAIVTIIIIGAFL
jgi:hypothetical protein